MNLITFLVIRKSRKLTLVRRNLPIRRCRLLRSIQFKSFRSISQKTSKALFTIQSRAQPLLWEESLSSDSERRISRREFHLQVVQVRIVPNDLFLGLCLFHVLEVAGVESFSSAGCNYWSQLDYSAYFSCDQRDLASVGAAFLDILASEICCCNLKQEEVNIQIARNDPKTLTSEACDNEDLAVVGKNSTEIVENYIDSWVDIASILDVKIQEAFDCTEV